MSVDRKRDIPRFRDLDFHFWMKCDIMNKTEPLNQVNS